MTAATAATGARPGEAFPRITDDGAWCWFADPRAVCVAGPGGHRGRLYAGWVDRAGSIWIGACDLATGAIERHRLHHLLDPNDHANPTILVRADGHLLVFYSRHDGDAIYCAMSARPGDITAWAPTRALRPNTTIGNEHAYERGSDNYTYPSAFQPAGEGGRIYLFWRGLGYKPNFAVSDDGGSTFSPGRIAIAAPGSYEDRRPYTKILCGADGRIHIAMTDGHPRDEPDNGVYYACLAGGVFRRADGGVIASAGLAPAGAAPSHPGPAARGLPFAPADADRVYDARTAGARAWVWDVAVDPAGHPVIAYVRLPDIADHRYCYARWDGERWHDHEITAAGRWFCGAPGPGADPLVAPAPAPIPVDAPAGAQVAEEREPHYSPGLVLDPADPGTVYLSRRPDDRPDTALEIERWTTTDLGATWTRAPITAGSRGHNVRPFVAPAYPANAARCSCVLWMQLRRYAHYTEFDAAIAIALP